jgi:hypothetical protein
MFDSEEVHICEYSLPVIYQDERKAKAVLKKGIHNPNF